MCTTTVLKSLILTFFTYYQTGFQIQCSGGARCVCQARVLMTEYEKDSLAYAAFDVRV